MQKRKLEGADQRLPFARWMEDDLIAQVAKDPVITVEVTVALNGRPPVRFVDPNLDLTRIDRSFEVPDWTTLYPTPLTLGDLTRSGPGEAPRQD